MGIEAKLPPVQPHRGPLKEVFKRECKILPRVEVVFDYKQFMVLVDCFVDNTPGREFLRLLYINPETVAQMALQITPEQIEIKRTSGPGESEQEVRPIFSKKIEPSLPPEDLDWSIEEVEIISEQSLVAILNELDPRVNSKKEEIRDERGKKQAIWINRIESRPAKEIAELIGQNLGLLS